MNAPRLQLPLMAAVLLTLAGCITPQNQVSAAPMREPRPGYQPTDPAYAGPSSTTLAPSRTVTSVELLLFGGRNHNVFLGCLNCSKYDSGSVWNKYGDHGSRYSNTSIWNRYGAYGSKYSDECPWNRYGSTPPVVVDRAGNFYGYFTANRHFSDRTTIQSLLQIVDNYEAISENLDDVIDSLR